MPLYVDAPVAGTSFAGSHVIGCWCLGLHVLLNIPRASHQPGPQGSNDGDSGAKVQRERRVENKKLRKRQSGKAEKGCRNVDREGCDPCKKKIDSNICGTTYALDGGGTNYTSQHIGDAIERSGDMQFLAESTTNREMELEGTSKRSAQASSEESAMQPRAGPSVMDLIRQREASASSSPPTHSASQATLSPSFAALRHRNKVDKSAWISSKLMQKDPGMDDTNSSGILGSLKKDNLDRIEAAVGKVIGSPRSSEHREDSCSSFSLRSESLRALSPSLAAARNRKQAALSLWGGDTSSPSSSSADATSSPGSETSMDRPTERQENSKAVKLVWPPHPDTNDPSSRARQSRSGDSKAGWRRTGAPTGNGESHQSTRNTPWISTGVNANPFAANVPQKKVGPARRKNPGPKGGPFDEEEVRSISRWSCPLIIPRICSRMCHQPCTERWSSFPLLVFLSMPAFISAVAENTNRSSIKCLAFSS